MDYTSEIAELLSRHGFRRFAMSRSKVGHLQVVGHLDGRPLDIVVDTGASKTFLELGYCRSEGIAVSDTGDPGAPAAGSAGTAANVHMVGDVQLTLEGVPVRSDGIFAIDMTATNQRLLMKGAEPIRAVIGQDVLRYHQAVIDYAALALFLREMPT